MEYMSEEQKEHVIDVIIDVLLVVLLIVLLIVILCMSNYMYNYKYFRTRGYSMRPAIVCGDEVEVRNRELPERGDIIAIRFGKEYFIKRCIALPGDMVQIKDGQVILNGIVQDESAYIEAARNTENYAGKLEMPITLHEGQYVVLGDNRNESRDSRDFGLVKAENLIGTVIKIDRGHSWWDGEKFYVQYANTMREILPRIPKWKIMLAGLKIDLCDWIY
jgi:signal peptidase I